MTTINTLDDFLQALDDNPSWREGVRARILDEELRQLPVRFNAFVEEQRAFNREIRGAVEEIRAATEELRAFNEEQRVVNEEQRAWNRNTTERFNRMEGDMSIFKNFYASRQPFNDAHGIAGDFGLEFVRVLTMEDLSRMGGNSLPRDVHRSFRNADLVIEGADETGSLSYIVIEVSYTADTRDTGRAIRNAELITRFTGRPAQPVIASMRNDYEVQELIESGAVHWYEVRDHAGRDKDEFQVSL